MAKELVKFEKEVGGDGAKASGALTVDAMNLTAQVMVQYPTAKVIEPATKALDSAIDKLKALIPGNWDDVMLEGVKAEYKQEIAKLLAE
jgi:6-phosphogluconate dehydrogenase (decarboxylating)